jgi:hypothetical protein
MNPGVFSRDHSLTILINHQDIQLRQTTDGTVLQTLLGQPAPIFIVQLSPDGTRLVAGQNDGTLVIWGLSP